MMDWLQVLVLVITIIVGNISLVLPLWLWNRSESTADRREVMSVLREMKDEMKDFHSKLLVLEDRYLRTISKE